MNDRRDGHSPASAISGHQAAGTSPGDRASRRQFLKSSAGLVAGGTAAQVVAEALPGRALAQNAGPADADAELGRLQSARRILFKGGIVLTLDRQVGDFAQADMLVEDGKIGAVQPTIALSDDDAMVIDASEWILIPGFVDAQAHSYQGLLRSTLPSGLMESDYNRDIEDTITPVYQPSDVFAGVLVTALGMISMGTTAMVDLSQSNHTPEHTDALIAALKEAGIRTVCAYSRGSGPQSQYPQDTERLRRTYFSSEDQLLTLALATRTDRKSFQYAREAGLRAVVHVRINSGPVIALGEAGLLRPGDEYIHCIDVNDQAWRWIRDSGGRTAHSPQIEMAMGHGMPAIQDALDHGLRPSLGSDHASTVAQDMFGMMRTTFELQRLSVLQRAHRGERNLPPLLTPREVLEFATIEGARCASLDSKIGTLTPGKDADITVLRADRLDVWPHNNAFGTVTNLMNPSHVETVLIAGKVKKWRGNLVAIDAARVGRLVEEARDAVMRRANFKVDLLG